MREDKQHCINLAREWIDQNVLILDTETTGLNEWAELCELSIIDCQGNTVIDTLVKPSVEIPDEATRIHGITNDMVKDAPTWTDIHEQFCNAIKCQRVVIYNSPYDIGIIHQTFRAGTEYNQDDYSQFRQLIESCIDPSDCVMRAYATYYGDWNDYRHSYRWQRLGNAARQCGVDPEGAHRALADCKMTLGIIQYMTETQSIPVNPELPENFDNTPNDERPDSHKPWWYQPFIVSWENSDGVFYEVRCLDGGAWDRSTWKGQYKTQEDAEEKALELKEKYSAGAGLYEKGFSRDMIFQYLATGKNPVFTSSDNV